jgi:hypothetical protein
VNWGTLGDVPLPADYDGDGRTDVAVWRPGAIANFYIIRSTGGSVGVPWGTSFDLPIAR